jgi:hypothetical protein
MSILIIIFLVPVRSFAFLDFLGDQTKKAIEAAAYADALGELMFEVVPDEESKKGANDIRARSDKLRSEASSLRYLSQSTKSVLNGPDWSSNRLESNIRATSDYVRRLRKTILRIAALGTDGSTALNTAETNVALNEVQKNQQTMILQNEDAKIRQLEKEHEEAKQWDGFSQRQRKIRKKESENGKLR